MRTLVHTAAAWLGMLAAGAVPAATPPAPIPAPLPRIVVAFANVPHSAPGPAGATGSRYAGQGYRVSQSAHQQARRVAAAYSLHEIASWPIKALSMHCVVFEITNGQPVAEVLAELSRDPRVMLAQPLQEFHTLTDTHLTGGSYNDPLYDLQTNLVTLGIARAHERTQGAGVRIALIDTAVDSAHPDLAGRILGTHSFIATRPRSPALLRHGTAMAGLIAAVANNHIGIVGIAPLAQLEIFEACWQLEPDNDAAACNTFTLAQALAAAIASGAPLINLSFAGPADPLLSALVQSGLRRGVTFVGAAAGPGAPFPTAIPGVISASGSEHPLPAGSLPAPAEHVLTLRPGGQYDFESGTSVAAAELTGLIALLMAAAPKRPAGRGIAQLLRETAAPEVVNVNAALARLEELQGAAHLATRGMH
ncbi:MAG TPA: S8 family serine peptidase [Steroidobacteraceae bacterium]|nr:S8 family serine peptidase [Steroidobacteraceae bacterium]